MPDFQEYKRPKMPLGIYHYAEDSLDRRLLSFNEKGGVRKYGVDMYNHKQIRIMFWQLFRDQN